MISGNVRKCKKTWDGGIKFRPYITVNSADLRRKMRPEK